MSEWMAGIVSFFDDAWWLRRFCAATALVFAAYAANVLLGEVDPGGPWGYAYGWLAAALMLGAAAIGVRRRMNRAAAKRKLGSTRGWLQFHLYGGTLSLLLVFMHCGFAVPTGALDFWLWLLSIWVTASGLVGALLQKTIPRMLASGLSVEVVYERIPELVAHLRARAEGLAAESPDPVRDFYTRRLADAFARPEARWSYLTDITGGIQERLREFAYLEGVLSPDERERFTQLRDLYRSKLEIDAHYTLQKPLRAWLVTHLPVSLLLLALLLIHIFTVVYY